MDTTKTDGDELVDRLPPLGPDPVIEAYKKDVDVTLLRENLKLTPTQRFQKLMELQRFASELRRAGRNARQLQRDQASSENGSPR